MKKELYLPDKIDLKQNSEETKVTGDDLAKNIIIEMIYARTPDLLNIQSKYKEKFTTEYYSEL